MSERKQQNTMSRMNPETAGREQMKDPHCFLCGNIPVKISFASDGEELEDVLKKYFMALK